MSGFRLYKYNINYCNSTHTGAIVGGVIGGVVALAVLLAIYRWRNRRAQKPSIDLDAEPKIEPFLTDQPYYPGSKRYSSAPQLLKTEGVVAGAHASPHAAPSRSSLREKSRTAIANPSVSQIASANSTSPTRAGSSSAYSPGSSEVSRPRIQQEHPMLTDDQADFVNNLYANNVPAAAIARVIERMIAGERQPVVDGYDSLPPPSYYHVSDGA